MCFQTADACDIQSNFNFRFLAKFEAGIYLKMSRENITYFYPVGNVELFDSHRDSITTFLGSLVSD